MTRAALPNVRRSIIRETEWEGHPFLLGIGFYDDGTPGEVFADRPKTDQMQATLSDACTLISIALQHGITASALAKSLGEVPDPWRGKGATRPASPIGVILAEIDAEMAEQAAEMAAAE